MKKLLRSNAFLVAVMICGLLCVLFMAYTATGGNLAELGIFLLAMVVGLAVTVAVLQGISAVARYMANRFAGDK